MAMIARVVKNQLSCIMRAQVKSHSQSIPGILPSLCAYV